MISIRMHTMWNSLGKDTPCRIFRRRSKYLYAEAGPQAFDDRFAPFWRIIAIAEQTLDAYYWDSL
jgi:hypothetical protein